MKWKRIRDIRYFETGKPIEYGSADVRHMGTIYPVDIRHPLLFHLGDRYSLKLAEYGFSLPGYNHVYIVLTPCLAKGEASLCDFHFETWQRYVTVGMPPGDWASLDEEGKFESLVASTTSALKHLCGEYEVPCDSVERTARQVLTEGTELEIGVKHKETGSYTVRVSYQIAPPGKKSVAYIEYMDKKSGRKGKTVLTPLVNDDDIHFLVSSISVSKGMIRLTPRASSVSSFYTRSYRVPLEVPVAQLLAAGEEWHQSAGSSSSG